MITTLLHGLLALLLTIYCVNIYRFFKGLNNFLPGKNSKKYFVTIIIPARNEQANIEKCLHSLLAQTYPSQNVQIIVVDDNSTDATAWLIKTIADQNPRVELISLGLTSNRISPKKRAITRAIAAGRHELIFTVDADCLVPDTWLETMITYFEPNVGMVAGPVLYHQERNIFHHLQALEFLGLVSAGAGSLGLGKPLIANGANLAYRKDVFKQVQGFQGFAHIQSGDDDLLMQKIARQTDWKIRFAPDLQAVVKTIPSPSLKIFLQQRTRWASKTTIYPSLSLRIFLISTYLLYAVFFFAIPLIGINWISGLWCATAFFLKAGFDWLVVNRGCHLFQRKDLLKYFPIAEILQIPYILYVGFRGALGQFEWKGR